MVDTEAFREFKQALDRMRDADAEHALPHIRRAVELEAQNPFYISYLGVVLARAEQKWAEAEENCRTALKMKRDQPQLYLNLAEVYVFAGRRDDAVETLMRGLKYANRDIRLKVMLGKLVRRRSPVIPFLERQHFLNRQLGLLRHRTMNAFGQA
jgi:Flp pilus assembly protein TadD